MSCGIYCIENIINHKKYIGQSIDIEERWERHKRDAFYINSKTYDYPLYRSIRKHGLQNFNFYILELCDITKLNELEMKYIQEFDTFNNGYNLTLGGDGTFKYKWKDILDEYQQQPISIRKIAEKYDIPPTTLRAALLRNNIKIWYSKNEEVEKEFIEIYDRVKSIREVSRITGRTTKYISRVLKENGYIIKQEKSILVYDLRTGNFIEKLNNSQNFVNKYGSDPGTVSNVLKGKTKSTMGYVVRYYKEGYPEKIDTSSHWKLSYWGEE